MQSAIAQLEEAESALDQTLLLSEFPSSKNEPDECIYLNTGSCGRKPASVLAAINQGWQNLNINPTYATFLDEEPQNSARDAIAKLLGADTSNLILTQNSTQGLQLIMQSLLREEGDHFITTNTEHGSVNTIARYLAEERGVTTSRASADPKLGSAALCQALLAHITTKTRLILVSQISSYTGWRANLTSLEEEAAKLGVAVLIDGAHAMGQLDGQIIGPSKLWVGSAHKWLGGPNGTGVVYVAREMISKLKPVAIGDYFYTKRDADLSDLTSFESGGTADVVRWNGLTKACQLQEQFGINNIRRKQLSLARYLRHELERQFQPSFRTPDFLSDNHYEASSLVTCNWPAKRLKTNDLRQSLWDNFKIWTQPDFLNEQPGHGIRVACHYANNKDEIDKLLQALKTLVV